MNTFSTTEQNKRNNIFFILSGIFITNAIIAEILGTKIFEFDFILNFNMSVGVIIWPVVFITTDIINEYFGKKGIKKISYFTILLIIYVFIIIYMSTKLTPNNYWLNINNVDNHGNPFNIDYAYNIIFLQSTGIIIGSIIAFLIAQILDVIVFHKLKKMTKGKFIWLVLFIAFYLLAPNDKIWSLSQVFSVGFDNYTFKFIIAILITPLIYLVHYLIDNYMGEALAKKCKNRASNI